MFHEQSASHDKIVKIVLTVNHDLPTTGLQLCERTGLSACMDDSVCEI